MRGRGFPAAPTEELMVVANPRVVAFFLAALLGAALAGCSTNPVTGQRELALVSESQELAIGGEQYAPTRQAQGGDFVLDPALTAYVREVGNRLAAVSDRDLPYEFHVINDSTPNAWALPGGKIAVNRGLLGELQSEAELAAVLGHEIVHAAARHSAQGMERGLLLEGAVMAAGVALQGRDYSDLALGAASVGAELVNRRYGRDAEREADSFGMRYMVRAGYDPQAAVSLQETFVRLAESRREDWLSGLFASHPPSLERVENNRRTARELDRPGLVTGADAYQRRTAYLQRIRPAYEHHERGTEALRAGDPVKALSEADAALAIEPREALFHELRGDALAGAERYPEALASYDRAVADNRGFFRPYVKRGLVYKAQGEDAAARRDLERSVDLLPTATAYNALGELALAGGDRSAAAGFFRRAAGAESAAGKAAAASLARLEISDRPERHLQAGVTLDGDRMLVVAVRNQSALAVQDVEIELRRMDGSVGRGVPAGRIGGVALGPGERRMVPTGIGPFADAGQARLFDARVVSARVAGD
jgi:predicted Zn-dependent protease